MYTTRMTRRAALFFRSASDFGDGKDGSQITGSRKGAGHRTRVLWPFCVLRSALEICSLTGARTGGRYGFPRRRVVGAGARPAQSAHAGLCLCSVSLAKKTMLWARLQSQSQHSTPTSPHTQCGSSSNLVVPAAPPNPCFPRIEVTVDVRIEREFVCARAEGQSREHVESPS